ncbi:hypothetical protein [Jeotgalibacillus sp. R-1-5s-1]|uniref:hypothetical protein n=1 Tax=Jeotgalibacillus sp. R-1-5s-1 TaxID=2555897 RepID=UPI00106BC878|nr:hypothetical protein [Jeotgalibacillus sp. R-1-5s-1]TFD92373.1 hypothetical protein E2491_16440 [Jeotgalibacillus sp. R-1-5s-1]
MICPNCSNREVGMLTSNRYFCHSCCVEFTRAKNKWKLYEITEDGLLTHTQKIVFESAEG